MEIPPANPDASFCDSNKIITILQDNQPHKPATDIKVVLIFHKDITDAY